MIVGHKNFIDTFNNAWNKKNVYPIHPVWILSGVKGIGKATICNNLAKNIYETTGDFFVVDLNNNIDKQGNIKTNSKTISVYTIRNLKNKLSNFAMSDGWRVIIIDALDELTIEAQNSLLKLLEEPPKKTLFLCVCHTLSKVLPTIISRSRVEKLSPLNKDEILELCKLLLNDKTIPIDLINISGGSFGKINTLYNNGGLEIYNSLIYSLTSDKSNSVDIKELAKKLADIKEFNLLTDIAYKFQLSSLYFKIIKKINDINELNLNAELIVFNLLMEIKKCL